jgi:DNA primase
LELIKKHIYEEDRVEEILYLLGCEKIRPEGGKLIVAQLPPDFLSNNKRAVQVNITNEKLNCYIRNREFNGDIYSLVSFIHHKIYKAEEIKKDLYNAKQWIVDQLGCHHLVGQDDKPKNTINNWLKDIQKKRKKRKRLAEQKPNKVLSEEILEQYEFKPYYGWFKEGISLATQIEWETGYDRYSCRVINPVRNANGELIGVKGRATLKGYNPDQKYLYLYNCNKSIELYGLWKTLPHIIEKKEVIVFEGYKSVMKAWQMGYKNCVSMEGDDLSDHQIALLKSLGIDIKIVLAYDKDRFFKVIENEETGERKKVFSMEYIETQANKFTNRKVFSIMDKDNELDENAKHSPVDLGIKVWNRVYENKILLVS